MSDDGGQRGTTADDTGREASAGHDHLIAPSILAADFGDLAGEVARVADVVEWIHVDVMDGHYVPNLTLGPDTLAALRRRVDHVLDTHLMVTDPRTWAHRFADAGANAVTFHLHTDDDPVQLTRELHERGVRVGIAIKPGEPLSEAADLLPLVDLVLLMTVEPGFGGQDFDTEVLPKISEARRLRAAEGHRWRLQVDGGVDVGTIGGCARRGADTFVAGSAVFGRDDPTAAVAELLGAATGS